jgi:septum formation topological specificity factor MinE
MSHHCRGSLNLVVAGEQRRRRYEAERLVTARRSLLEVLERTVFCP